MLVIMSASRDDEGSGQVTGGIDQDKIKSRCLLLLQLLSDLDLFHLASISTRDYRN